MSRWPILALEDLQAEDDRAISIGPFGSRMKKDCYRPSGVPILRGNNITDTRQLKDDFVFIDESKADELAGANVFPDDLYFPHRGSIGEVGIVPHDRYPRYVLSTAMMKISLNKSIVDPLYVYYFFRSPEGRREILMNESTVGTPGIGQPLSSLRRFKLPVPPLPVQRAIADGLGTLDDKIELNRRMNRTLEAIARAIFKSWFVDFDPVHAKAEGREPVGMDPETAALFPDSFQDSPLGKIPKGWEAERLGKHVDITRGLSYRGKDLAGSGTPLHNLNSIYEGGGYKREGIKFYRGEFKERHTTRPGDILVANTEQTFDLLLIGYPASVPTCFGEEGIYTHHLYRIRVIPESQLTNDFLYHALLHECLRREVANYSNGTTVNMLPKDALQRPFIVVSPRDLLLQYGELCQTLHNMAERLQDEIVPLGQTRDVLLPRLLSGKVLAAEAAAGRIAND